MNKKEFQTKVWSLIKDIKVGMLTTVHEKNLVSRPMQLIQDEFSGKIWLFTDVNEAKVDDINKSPQVNLNFTEPKNDTYVSLSGKAKLTQDQKLIDKFWNDYIGAWYRSDKKGEHIALLEIEVEQGEFWNNNSSKLEFFYEVQKAKHSTYTPDIGENESFSAQ